MALDLLKPKGMQLKKQNFAWRDLVRNPISKLNDDAFTRVRIILINGLEQDQNRFLHILGRFNPKLKEATALLRRRKHHQQTLVHWLLSSDHSPLETTIAYEQTAIEVTAAIAQLEPDPYLAQVYRFGLLEDFDHMYRFAALMDRVEGRDPNNILQCYTDILPGRPTIDQHRSPENDLRESYVKEKASVLSKLHALTITAGEHQTRDFYMTIGPMFSDPLARQVYAEIASIEEQHVTQYGSLTDPAEGPLEHWLLREANTVYNYYSCVETETNTQIKAIWEKLLDCSLGQLAYVIELFKEIEKRDPSEVLPENLPKALPYASQRTFVREVLANEIDIRTKGTSFVAMNEEDTRSLSYRKIMNHDGAPTEIIAQGYAWAPGTELARNVIVSMENKRKMGAKGK